MKPNKLQLSDEQRREQLEALGLTIAAKRDEAIEARKASGIEEVWMACEEAYLGIDDQNRAEFAKAKWAKPTSAEGAVATERSTSDNTRSTAYVRMTSRYVDAGSAKLGEILLPIDDKAFSIDPTPIPDLIKQKEDLSPIVGPDGKPVMRPVGPDANVVPGAPMMPGAPAVDPTAPTQLVPMTNKDLAENQLNQAKDAAKKAEKRIYDWMVECKYHAEMRKVIDDAARIGAGVLKAPFPEEKQSQAVTKGKNGLTLRAIKKVVPAARWVDPWNLFPDGACGENIHHGDYILERDFLSPRKLKALKGGKGYLSDQIDKVYAEGPGKCNSEGTNPNEKPNKKRFEVWYYYGTLTRKEMQLVNAPGIDVLPEGVDEVYAIAMLVNDTVVRAIINPLQSGKFPYHVMPWTRRAGHWAGVGVAEQVSTPQRMCTAATRAMLNNAGISAGAQIIVDQFSIVPADGKWTITPNKIWLKASEAPLDDVRKAFTSVKFDNIQEALMAIIEYSFRLAEEASNIPLITQGQTGPTTPDTLGATQLQNSNANTLLRKVGYSFDDHITEPVVTRFYEWLLLDPSVPDEEKGDFQINAHGSVALVERAIQDQTIQMMGGMVKDPVFGANPRKWFSMFLKSKRIDPRDVQYTEEEQKKIDEMAAKNPPQDPRIKAAEIMAEARLKEADMRGKTQQAVAGARVHGEMAYAETEAQIARDNHAATMEELRIRRELELLKYANQNQQTLEMVKADLAKAAMDNRTKRELAAAEIALASSEGDKDRATRPNSLQRDEMTTPTTP